MAAPAIFALLGKILGSAGGGSSAGAAGASSGGGGGGGAIGGLIGDIIGSNSGGGGIEDQAQQTAAQQTNAGLQGQKMTIAEIMRQMNWGR